MTTVTFSLSDNFHDAEERADTNVVSLASSDLEIGHDAAPQYVGMMWPNVTIAPGSVIAEAYITFVSTEDRSGAMTVQVYGHDVDDSTAFSASDGDLSTRPLTAPVNWSPEDWVTGEEYNTADLSSIIQTIIDRAGWESGNNLAIIIGPHDTLRRTAWSYNGSAENSPVLVVTYALTAPSDLAVTSAGRTQIELSWTDNSTGETGFNIERSLDGSTGWVLAGTVGANVETFTDLDITPGETYFYRVRAMGDGPSDYSNVVAATAKRGGLIMQIGHSIQYRTTPTETAEDEEPINLVANPTFDDSFDNWTTAGQSVTRETDTGRDSPAARVVQSTEGSAALQSNYFVARPDHRYYFELDLKMVDVVYNTALDWYKLRITIRFYDENYSSIRHYDRTQSWGSRDWGTVRREAIAPAGTKYATITVALSNTTGEYWVDNVAVYEQAPKGPSAAAGVYNPVMIPKPWKMTTSGRKAVEGTVTEGVQGDTAIDAALAARWPDNDWDDLTDEGYFISVDTDGDVVLGGKTAHGLYYAQRTFERLQDGQGNVYICDVLDTPTLDRRGLVIGVQNWSLRETIAGEMGALKYNFSWHQGSFNGESMSSGGWRTPLTPEQEASFASWLASCNANYITPWMIMLPRGDDYATATTYSDGDEVTAAVNKFIELYDLGYRHFGFGFDDLQVSGQDVLTAADQLEYASIGEAHADFTTNVYNALDTYASDPFSFSIIPLWYNGVTGFASGQTDYITTLLNGIPSAIDWVFVGPEEGGAAMVYSWISKPATMWDNFWASFYVPISRPAPAYVVPLDREIGEEVEDAWAGYLLLPPPPTGDALSASKIEWTTSADFAWAPDRYDKTDAEKRAIADFIGVPDVPWAD